MQFIKDIHQSKSDLGKPAISFEFFPPKTEKGESSLFSKTIPELLAIQPDYCSVTYGAGGGTKGKTLEIVSRIQQEFRLTCMSHLTCVGATEAEIRQVLDEASELGIRNILALRGDPPGGTGDFVPTEGGFTYSKDLVSFIRSNYDFSIGVAGFPEGHIACKEGREVDWERLKGKVDAGADFVMTQLFFSNEDFLRFRDHMVKQLGMTQTIIPGILPVLSTNQIKRFTELCGATIPDKMMEKLNMLENDDTAATEFGIEFAVEQCEELLKEGVKGLHFYSLNKSYSTVKVVEGLSSFR
ncbi:MAG: methylenetetrahydrofolate reductase [NAD(P)H] [Verrucomicrobia bacterium]|nr:methylenetetrahydrofolate reductase [NAD(P)H] [Verrucomicrobiota bacterium]